MRASGGLGVVTMTGERGETHTAVRARAADAGGSHARPRGQGAGAATCLLLALCGSCLVVAALIVVMLIGTVGGPFLRVGWQALPPTARPFGPTWTPMATPTSRPPTPTPGPTSTRTYTQRFEEALGGIRIAEDCVECEPEQILITWNEVLGIVPEYVPGYYGRSRAYLGLGREERSFEAAQDDLLHALEDIDYAISMADPAPGDYYLLRHDVYGYLGALEDARAERVPLWELAYDDLTMAIRLGNSSPLAPRTVAFNLVSLGDCEGGLAEAERLQGLIEPGDTASAGIQTALAQAHLCLGDYAAALTHLDLAIEIQDSADRQFDRAIALYGLGRLEDSLEALNSWIGAQPTLSGYRYYVRALIRYDLGEAEVAEQDLRQGAANTWGRGGVAALVGALLARDAGDQEGAIELLHLAEGSMESIYRPMLERAQQELSLLGAVPTEAAPAAVPTATPTPATSPFPEETAPPATPTAAAASYEAGTNMFTLGWNEYRTFRFAPATPSRIAEVLALTVRIEPTILASTGVADLYLWNPEENFWSMFSWDSAEIRIPNPGRFVLPGGELFLSILRSGQEVVTLANVTARMDVVLLDGSKATFGPTGE